MGEPYLRLYFYTDLPEEDRVVLSRLQTICALYDIQILLQGQEEAECDLVIDLVTNKLNFYIAYRLPMKNPAFSYTFLSDRPVGSAITDSVRSAFVAYLSERQRKAVVVVLVILVYLLLLHWQQSDADKNENP